MSQTPEEVMTQLVDTVSSAVVELQAANESLLDEAEALRDHMNDPDAHGTKINDIVSEKLPKVLPLPIIDSEGKLSFKAADGTEYMQPVSIKGEKGDEGDRGDIGDTPNPEFIGTALQFKNGVGNVIAGPVELKGEQGVGSTPISNALDSDAENVAASSKAIKLVNTSAATAATNASNAVATAGNAMSAASNAESKATQAVGSVQTAVTAANIAGQAAQNALGASTVLADRDSAGRVRLAKQAEISSGVSANGEPVVMELEDAKRYIGTTIVGGEPSPICGIARLYDGGGAGAWMRVDADGNPMSPTKTYFDNHPIYKAIFEGARIIDGQYMHRIPKFGLKYEVPTTGVFAGKLVTWIAPEVGDGFEPWPAFNVYNGTPMNEFFVGTYQGGSEYAPAKMVSRPGIAPVVSLDFATMKARAEARNTGGVSGFQMWDVYQLGAIKLLALIEMGTPDMQSVLGRGRVDTSSAANVDAADVVQASWRGITGLWGNVWQMVDGLRGDASARVEAWARDGSRLWKSTNVSLPGGTAVYPITMQILTGDNYDFRDLFMAATVDSIYGNGSYADGNWGTVANAAFYHGGYWDYGSNCGLFSVGLCNAASYSHACIGSRLAKV